MEWYTWFFLQNAYTQKMKSFVSLAKNYFPIHLFIKFKLPSRRSTHFSEPETPTKHQQNLQNSYPVGAINQDKAIGQ